VAQQVSRQAPLVEPFAQSWPVREQRVVGNLDALLRYDDQPGSDEGGERLLFGSVDGL
jgi:hypothetical protein